jgi:endonuclease YncB( thermonuclease family)
MLPERDVTMLVALWMVLAAFVPIAQNAPCKPGTVVEVAHGRDYTLTICGEGVVALRGVEAPLRTASGLPIRSRGESHEAMVGRPTSGEILGDRNVSPEAVAFLSKLIGRPVKLVNDGYRIGDAEGRRYAYVYLSDKSLLNAQMIQLGYGYAERQGSHPRRDEFIAIEAMARRSKVGVWGS